MAEIRINSLQKEFGAFKAVDNVNVVINDGEFVFLLGPSGCGKTTTLRMIAGLEMPTSGKIEIEGRDVTFLRPRHRNVGMVFQDYGLYRHLTVFGNIAYPLQVRHFSKNEIAEKVKAVANTMQITSVLDKKPDSLSSGQLQRVAIARMLVRDADVFLMDEPMSHLDAQLRGQMRAELRHIQKTIGVTTIFVTHDQLEAMTMADRIIVMKDGQMLQFATAHEIFERPATEFVATFVGEPQMNVFDVIVERNNDVLSAKAESFTIPLNQDWAKENNLESLIGRKVRLGIRPEHISIRAERTSDHTIEATLFSFEPTGSENLYVLKCGNLELTTRSSTTETAHLGKIEGSQFAVRLDPNWLYIFDGLDGRTLAYAHASRDHSEEM